jgi:pimeloyl-ACP methyl ester carboxylesterase
MKLAVRDNPCLMLAPGGFDSTADKWLTASAWKEINALDKLSSKFQLIVYDRRESGKSSGRVEKLTWDLYARQAKGLLDHLKIDSAFVLGGCMGCSVALSFAVCFPQATRALCSTGRWEVTAGRQNTLQKFATHGSFVKDKGISAVAERGQNSKGFREDSESGPWAHCLTQGPGVVNAFRAQDGAPTGAYPGTVLRRKSWSN